jgi:hypothetical protein
MSAGWTKIFVCVAAAIGYAQQLFAGTPYTPFERVIWPDDPDQIEAYCDIRALLLKSFERWNAHDIDGFMEAAWKSDDLVTTLDGHAIRGWRQILAAYHRGYTDQKSMGTLECNSLGTDLLSPDRALVLFGWTQTIDGKKTIGSSSSLAARFSCGWRVISNESEFYPHTYLDLDPRHLSPGKIVPFAYQDSHIDPNVLSLNVKRFSRAPIRLFLSLE